MREERTKMAVKKKVGGVCPAGSIEKVRPEQRQHDAVKIEASRSDGRRNRGAERADLRTKMSQTQVDGRTNINAKSELLEPVQLSQQRRNSGARRREHACVGCQKEIHQARDEKAIDSTR